MFSILTSSVTLCALLGLLCYLAWGSLPILASRGFGFLSDPAWDYRSGLFGAAALLYGTLATSFIALLMAVPFGVLAATFMAEYLSAWPRVLLKQALELLAAVPSVVYGLLGVVLLRPLIHKGLPFLGAASGDTLLTGGLLLAVMILPTVLTLSEDAIRGVAKEPREAALALGLTRWEVISSVVWPQASRGIMSAVLLGLGRALGETIAVFLVVGRADGRLPSWLFGLDAVVAPGQTMTTKLGGSEIALAYGHPEHWSAMLGVAALLMCTVGLLMGLGLVLRGRRS